MREQIQGLGTATLVGFISVFAAAAAIHLRLASQTACILTACVIGGIVAEELSRKVVAKRERYLARQDVRSSYYFLEDSNKESKSPVLAAANIVLTVAVATSCGFASMENVPQGIQILRHNLGANEVSEEASAEGRVVSDPFMPELISQP